MIMNMKKNTHNNLNMKIDLNMNAKLNMNDNTNEYEIELESRNECEEEYQAEGEFDAANGSEMLSVCGVPRRQNEGRGGKSAATRRDSLRNV
jgi:hypothetical protein